MSILFSILTKYWPLIVAAALGGAIVGWTTHKVDGVELRRQQTAMASYKAQVQEAQLAAEIAAREALQKQIDDRHIADMNNEKVMRELRQRTADAESHYVADREFITRMLNASSKARIPPSGAVPETHDQPGSAPAGGAGSIEAVAELCADTKAEDQRNADRLDALIAQITPQVQP